MNPFTIALASVSALAASSALACGGCGCSAHKHNKDGAATPAMMTTATADIVDTAVAAGQFNTLAAALNAAGLVETLKGDGPFTVFAPTDAAFGNVDEATLKSLLQPENKGALTSVLTYHVVPGRITAADLLKAGKAESVQGQRLVASVNGDTVRIGGAKIVATDIEASNGIIHVIDGVMLPASDTIPQVAASAGSFNTLLAAVGAAGLADVLSSEGPFTVFAPTDAAFAALPAGTVENLLKPENKADLAAILTYHVVPGRVYADQALAAKSAKTVQGEKVNIAVKSGKPMVENANIVATDIDASNGVIHVIDAVILPPSLNAQAPATSPADVLRTAINRGAPMFNHGNHAACADLYEMTLMSLAAGNALNNDATNAVNNALIRAKRMHSATDRAWALRAGIDQALMATEGRRMTTASRH